VNQDGERLYCREELRTGSHARKQTSCLTQTQLLELHDVTRRAMDGMTRQAPAKHGT
jgi:hypothetical protein